ncbi:recombinase family protein [Maritalea sp.]|uniref:recombinase family protein n=1 Tax=Maritalea sp. TaxID=2003361 RepID=UPI0039E2A2E6
MKIGYLRVSTEEQNLNRQIDALTPLCDRLYVEKLSAIAKKRPVFDFIMNSLESGQTLVVWDLDRAFRSTIEAILCETELRKRNITFEIVSLKVNTAEPAGEFAYSIMAAAAQYERRMISERTKQGLAAARKRGVILGRPRKLSEQNVVSAIKRLAVGDVCVQELAQEHNVHPRSIRRAIDRHNNGL